VCVKERENINTRTPASPSCPHYVARVSILCVCVCLCLLCVREREREREKVNTHSIILKKYEKAHSQQDLQVLNEKNSSWFIHRTGFYIHCLLHLVSKSGFLEAWHAPVCLAKSASVSICTFVQVSICTFVFVLLYKSVFVLFVPKQNITSDLAPRKPVRIAYLRHASRDGCPDIPCEYEGTRDFPYFP
jgi:hypothetical protein